MFFDKNSKESKTRQGGEDESWNGIQNYGKFNGFSQATNYDIVAGMARAQSVAGMPRDSASFDNSLSTVSNYQKSTTTQYAAAVSRNGEKVTTESLTYQEKNSRLESLKFSQGMMQQSTCDTSIPMKRHRRQTSSNNNDSSQ